jgi:hypothetical protein
MHGTNIKLLGQFYVVENEMEGTEKRYTQNISLETREEHTAAKI